MSEEPKLKMVLHFKRLKSGALDKSNLEVVEEVESLLREAGETAASEESVEFLEIKRSRGNDRGETSRTHRMSSYKGS